MQVSLKPHPSSPPGPIESLEVMLEPEGSQLWLRFTVDGRTESVVWPRPAEGRADDLWRTTCFEAFVLADDGYVEFNLSPSGRWASYRFDAPRRGMRHAEVTPTPPKLNAGADRTALETLLTLPPGAARLGLSAVIEATDGTISYWALAHPSDKPDFHHPDSFVLELP
ncbi:MAG TPA: DOMON-like domain-containing protein [Brevundimonas sp.]|jgi:hypothetical protein|uniref:DOMON-like domain-containing protein n=1 Tax=Brevundimonas sp. TaxID=1871086 RepID=UPI002DEB07BE|nr:DOMON-like domain-containing protein [Brevundimonas sp.]